MAYTLGDAQKQLRAGKLRDAGRALDYLISQDRSNSKLWYLRGLVSLRTKNYDYAHECFVHALELEKKAAYYKIRGMAHMEKYEFEDALEQFEAARALEENDTENYFYIALCHLFRNNPAAKTYLEKAYRHNSTKTKKMIRDFFETFFHSSGDAHRFLGKLNRL